MPVSQLTTVKNSQYIFFKNNYVGIFLYNMMILPDDGDVVTVSEKQLSKGKLPAYVLEALAKKENVTLAILCEEFDILIPSEDAVADAGDTRLYTIDELVKMYE